MRRLLLGVGAAALILARAAWGGTLDPQSIQATTLPNGLLVLIKESHGADLAAVQYWVRAGTCLESAETAGTTHFIEHMWFKGTDRRPAGDIDEEIEDLGGLLEADTDKDWTHVRTTVASRYASRALEVIADLVQHPRFRAEDMDAERRIILDEIASTRADPIRFLINRLYATAFPTHPYRFEVTGPPETVLGLKQPQLKEFFQKNYALSNSVLIIVGDVQAAEVLRQVRTLFAAPGPPAKRPSAPPAERQAPAAASQRQVLDTDFQGAYLGVAYPAPGMEARDDVCTADVLVTLLEQGAWGRLPAALRGDAVSVHAGYQTLRQPGLLTITVQTSPEKLDTVEQTLKAELEKLRAAPPSAAEVEGTKRLLSGLFAVENERFGDQARTLGYYAAIDRWEFATTYLDGVRKVTPEQVQQLAARYLIPERAVTIILRPRPARSPS